MKNCAILAVLAALALGTPAGAVAEPCAPLVKLNEAGAKLMAQQGRTKADRLMDVPAKGMVTVPIYPGAQLASAMPPMMENSFPAINLVSNDPPAKVEAWYREHLPKGWTWTERFKLFHEGEGELDMTELYTTQTINVTEEKGKALDLMFADVPDVKSRIQIVYRPQQ